MQTLKLFTEALTITVRLKQQVDYTDQNAKHKTLTFFLLETIINGNCINKQKQTNISMSVGNNM